MMLTKPVLAAGAAALLVLGVAAVAVGQPAPPPGPPPPPGAERHPGRPLEEMRQHMLERREARAKAIHDALNLRPDQERAYSDLRAALGPRPGDRDRMREGLGPREGMSTPERLDLMMRRMQERQARFAERADAIKRFYSVLDTRQRQTFDSLVQMRGGMGMGMGMGPMGRMGHGGMMMRRHMEQSGPPETLQGAPPAEDRRGERG